LFAITLRPLRDAVLVAAYVALPGSVARRIVPPRVLRRMGAAWHERRFQAATDSSRDALLILACVRDAAGTIIDFRFEFANAPGATLLASTPTTLRGSLLREHAPARLTADRFERYKRVSETGERLLEDIAIDGPDRDDGLLRLQVVALDDGVAITATDISALRASEARLTAALAFKRAIVQSSPFATVVTDLTGLITSINPAAERMLWYRRDELVGHATPLLMLDPANVAARAATLGAELGVPIAPGMAVLAAMAERDEVDQREWPILRRDGSRFDGQLTISALRTAEGVMQGLIVIITDMTEIHRARDEATHQATHDALTGLPTRRLLQDRLNLAIARARRHRHRVGVLTIDLDDFKKVNDLLGHHAGDELLCVVAARLKGAVRSSDTVARMGGDEFVIVLDEVRTVKDVRRMASLVQRALEVPGAAGSDLPIPRASIGACVYPDNGGTGSDLLNNADTAMYHAKSAGRHGHEIFTDAMAAATSRKRQLELGLNQALARDEMELVYQPQVSMMTGLVTGVEALVRWRSPSLGLVMPGEFIPVAEANGMIVPIGEWVMRTACADGRRMQQIATHPVMVAVNLSPRQVQQESLPDVIRQVLADSGLSPATLELEITETLLVTDSPRPTGIIAAIRALGVGVSIDDFGTGFSSLAYLLRFRADRLKIDQSFVQRMASDADSYRVTSAIMALADSLGISVVAEGVETEAQRDLLMSEGCDVAQGYLFSRPVSAVRMLSLIGELEAAERRRGVRGTRARRAPPVRPTPLFDPLVRSALDAVPGEAALLAPDGRVLAVNSAWVSFAQDNGAHGAGTGLGLNYCEVCDRVEGADATDARMTAQGVRSVLAGEMPRFARDYACDSPTAPRQYHMEVRSLSPSNVAAAVVSHVEVRRDAVSDERAELEQQLQQLQRLDAVGRLVRGIGHDFNNLLTVIDSQSSVLAQSFGPHDERLRDAMGIQQAGKAATALVRQLLAFIRPQIVAPVRQSLNPIVTEAQRFLSRVLNPEIRLVVDLQHDLGDVIGDAGQLGQVIVNLAINARDAMPSGGVLSITTANATLPVDMTWSHGVIPAGQYVVLEIGDSGIGMDADTTARIFEPFFTTKPAGTASGLGLTIVRNIVATAGGHVAVKSATAAGSRFRIYLPTVVDFQPARELTARPTAARPTVLLVEDDGAVRDVATRMLTYAGYAVLPAANGMEALTLAADCVRPIDLVISDAVMPGMSGAETVRRLRESRPDLKALFTSGYSDEEATFQQIVPVDAAFVQKPYEFASLARAIREALGD
jgi:diguanylate cyclase (GGDEF)-like protein